MRLPFRPLNTLTREDGLLASLQRSIPKPKAQESRKNAWILEEMWRLIDKRVSACWGPERNQTLLQCPGRAINASLEGDKKWRTEEAGEAIESLLGSDPPFHKEA